MIDWSLPDAMVSKHFTVRECIYLPKWDRLADHSDGLNDGMKYILTKSALLFDQIRDLLEQPMVVHSFWRPAQYSPLVGGMDDDVHVQGLAVDFDCQPGLSTDEIKAILEPKLKSLGLRMEDNGSGSSWVHIDRHRVVYNRIFKV